MSPRWLRLVSYLCMTAFLAANTHAQIALATLVRVCSDNDPEVTSSTIEQEESCCKCCAKKSTHSAKIPQPKQKPCPPECPDCPKGPHSPACPCPGGCTLCSVAKTLCAPLLLAFTLQPTCLGTLPCVDENLHVLAIHSRLFRPPKA